VQTITLPYSTCLEDVLYPSCRPALRTKMDHPASDQCNNILCWAQDDQRHVLQDIYNTLSGAREGRW
jgi:hypothetical protein